MNEKNSNSAASNTAARAWKRRPLLIVVVLLAAVSIGAGLWAWLGSGANRAGQPVSAPRSTELASPTGQESDPAGQTITVEPAQLESAGLKIETVGEQIDTEPAGASATGVVEPNAYREVPVISLVGGVIRQVHVREGDNVSSGQTVAVVFSKEFAETQARYVALLTERDNAQRNHERAQTLVQINQTGRTEYEQAERQRKAAEAVLDETTKRFERTAKLVEIGAASREELEQDTTRLRTAEAEAEEARLRSERSKQLLTLNPQSLSEREDALDRLSRSESALAAAREELLLYGMPLQRIDSLRSGSQITGEIAVAAPVSGSITSRAMDPGEIVEMNREIMRITDLSTVWVIAQVFERDLANLRTGSPATVTSDAFPGRVFRGRLTYIGPSLDEATRTVQARVELVNPQSLLRIGMYVRVAFGASGMERTIPVVPASAVQTINEQPLVFVATGDAGVFELRSVRLGARSGAQYQIVEGLAVGDRVVTTGSFMLRAEWLKAQQSGIEHQH